MAGCDIDQPARAQWPLTAVTSPTHWPAPKGERVCRMERGVGNELAVVSRILYSMLFTSVKISKHLANLVIPVTRDFIQKSSAWRMRCWMARQTGAVFEKDSEFVTRVMPASFSEELRCWLARVMGDGTNPNPDVHVSTTKPNSPPSGLGEHMRREVGLWHSYAVATWSTVLLWQSVSQTVQDTNAVTAEVGRRIIK